MIIHQIPIGQISPLHEVEMPAHVDFLAKSLISKGWNGLPLLVEQIDNTCYQAWTGSHRYAASNQIGLTTVPCVIINLEKMNLHYPNKSWLGSDFVSDKERVSILEKINDEEALIVMRAERFWE